MAVCFFLAGELQKLNRDLLYYFGRIEVNGADPQEMFDSAIAPRLEETMKAFYLICAGRKNVQKVYEAHSNHSACNKISNN